jgi:class 3 adenylate cyclase
VVSAGLDMVAFIERNKQERMAKGQPYFELRLGIHTGPLVAGIVGLKKFAYDIWGDTVNTASRMESSGEVGRVNISGSTYELVKERFQCTYRGKVQAKNKGEIDMYFVEGVLANT